MGQFGLLALQRVQLFHFSPQLLANQEQRLNQHDTILVQLAETIQEIRSYIRFSQENGHCNGG